MGPWTSKVSFAIVIDERKTIPLLEEMAENGDEHDKQWANDYLKEIRQPSLSGTVTDTAGKPLKEVEISVTGPENLSYETRSNGRYYLGQLTRGGTYTLTPSLERDGTFDADYSFEPASRTITNLNSHPDVSDEPPPNEVFTKDGITDFDRNVWSDCADS